MTDFAGLMQTVIEGKKAEFVPFVPRLDIWYQSRKRQGTLPKRYQDVSLLDILTDLDIGYNTMIPDYLDHDGRPDYLHRGLGFHASRTSNVFTLHFHNVDIEDHWDGDRYSVTYRTPYGDLTTITRLDEQMKAQGSTIAVILKKAVESVQDFKAARYLFDNVEIRPDYERYNSFLERVGHRGLATCFVLQRESGFRMLNMDLMTYDKALYEQLDYPDEFTDLCLVLDRFLERCVAVACASPAHLLTVGAHYDTGLTPPSLFEQYTLPCLERYSQMIHASGKKMALHTDSENQFLLPLYIASGMDVADSICQKPLTRLSYRDIRDVAKDKITLYGLIPSITLLESSFSDDDFQRFLDRLFSDMQADGARRIILAIADTTPPGAPLERIAQIAKWSRQIKPI